MNIYYAPDTRTFTTRDTGYPVDEALKNAISASLTGGGQVWIEEGAIKTSGAAPAPDMIYDRASGAWQVDEQRRSARLADAKTYKLHDAADAAQRFIARVAGLDAVPIFERESWAMQAQEAQAWAANPGAPTPILAGIAKARGVPLDILRQKALAKAQAYAALTASVAGQRQAIEDKINAAEDMQALDAVVITYQMPGVS